jgi:hypothetical protein
MLCAPRRALCPGFAVELSRYDGGKGADDGRRDFAGGVRFFDAHPFTAFGGIGACADTPRAGKRRAGAASPFMGKLSRSD